MKTLVLDVLPQRFAVCRLEPDEAIPESVFDTPFWSITRTDEELSLVLLEEFVPSDCKSEKGWRCLKVLGPLDFTLTGILASLSGPLAEAGVSIFAISTYDTDYILVHDTDLDKVREVLSGCGHVVRA